MRESSKDPRLIELEFLSILEGKDSGVVITTNGTEPLLRQLGINQARFREFLLHMLIEGYINGPTTDTSLVHTDLIDSNTRRFLVADIKGLTLNYNLSAQINFKGRQRLWTLRDELNSLRRKDELGVLFVKDHAHRDWQVRSAFLKDGDPISLIYCDLDHFKSVNDTFNHFVGDAALKTFHRVLLDVVGDFGEGYRMGGDEAAAILPGLVMDQAATLAESLRLKLESEMKSMTLIEKLPQKPTASVGVATFLKKIPAEEAFKRADELAYKSKKHGKNRVTAEEFR